MSWPLVPFSEIIKDATSGNPKVKSRDYLNQGNLPVVDQGKQFIGGYVDDLSLACKISLPAIVFGDHTREVKYLNQAFALGADGVKILKPLTNNLDEKYLYYFLKQAKLPDDAGYSRHFKFVKRLEIPLPPIAEQKRIAAILDKADAIRRKRQQAIELTEQLLRSVFLDIFGDPDSNLKGWNIEPLSKIISSLEGGKNVKPAESSLKAKNRILKVSAVTSGVYRHNESKPLPADYVPPNSYFVKKGDLLISRANTAELIGASAYVHDTPDNIVLPDKIWRIKWKNIDDIDPLFVHFLLGQPAIRREISSRASGTSGSMKNIPKPKLLEIEIPLPPPKEQKKFGEIANAICKMNNRFQSAKVNYENLFNSLAQQAFSDNLSKRLENELA
ncbi:TPA: hypothetical protein F8R78_08095 [Legionella pneumophila]|nr:hypothetical protein [Legionella pneumophila]HBD7304470.1 restriction endonuclease subunit S [Legionella pneumophila]